MLRQLTVRLFRLLRLHWVELGVGLLSLLVLWQLSGITLPSIATPAVLGPPAQGKLANAKFAVRLPGGAPHAIDSVTVGGKAVIVGGIGRAVAARSGDTLVVNGWATYGAKAAGAVEAVIDGSSVFVTGVDLDRPDVANVLKNDNFARSGFSIAVPTAGLLPGVHHIAFRIVTPDLSGYYDATVGLTLSVLPAAAP